MIEDRLVEGLIEALWKVRETVYEHSEISSNNISWIDDVVDSVEIGYLKKEPDGDNQKRLAEEGIQMTREEAIEDIKVRLYNTLDVL